MDMGGKAISNAGTVTATSFVGALTGNASTATALAANPSDCSGVQLANAIAASGNLSCTSTITASHIGTTGTSVTVNTAAPPPAAPLQYGLATTSATTATWQPIQLLQGAPRSCG